MHVLLVPGDDHYRWRWLVGSSNEYIDVCHEERIL